MRRHSAFTLLESLLVLTVVSLFIMVPTMLIKKTTQTMATIYFFDQLEKSILTCQQVAIVSGRYTEALLYSPSQPEIVFWLNPSERLETLTIPETLRVPRAWRGVKFSGGTGNTNLYQNIDFIWDEKKQKITYRFLIGKGHYEKIITDL